MHRKASLCAAGLAFALVTSLIGAGASAESPSTLVDRPEAEVIQSSWIVSVDTNASPKALAAKASGHGAKVGGVFERAGHAFMFEGTATQAARVAAEPGVIQIEPNVRVELADQIISKTTAGLRRTRTRHPTKVDAHELGFQGAGSRIAIIDTGVDLDHPEFAGRLDNGARCFTDGRLRTGPRVADAGGNYDDPHHGTKVASNAAAGGARIFGMAPRARIVPIKVDLSVGAILCAVDFVTDRGGVDVANISLVYPTRESVANCKSSALHRAICRSVDAGTLYTAAAGNGFGDSANRIGPAKFQQVLAVSAMTDNAPQGERAGPDGLANFSNVGTVIDLMAPGTKVRSAVSDGYGEATGTSRAAPHVAGALAVLKAAGASPAVAKRAVFEGGECPDGTANATGGGNPCDGNGTWRRLDWNSGAVIGTDPDGKAEPFLNLLRALRARRFI